RRPWVHYPFRALPDAFRYRVVPRSRLPLLAQKKFVDAAKPHDVAMLIPSTHGWVYGMLRDKGVIVAAEMINTHRLYARKVLDEAFDRAGLPHRAVVSER